MSARRALRRLCAALCVLFGGAVLLPAHAVEFSAEPSVSLKTLFTDNFTLTTDPHNDVFGLLLSPAVKLNAEGEAWKVTGGAYVSFNRYWGQDGLNNTEGGVDLRSDYRAERNTYGLNVSFVRDNTLLSELATTGIVQAYTPRTQLVINPNWTYDLTEQTKLVTSYNFTGVNYSDTVGTSLIDYREQMLAVGLRHSLGERTTATLTGYYDFFETDPDNFKAQTAGLVGGIEHAFSETLKGILAAGPRVTHSVTSAQTQVCNAPIQFGLCTGTLTTLTSDVTKDSSGFTLTAELTQRWSETAAFNVRVAREINPTGVGALVQTDLVKAGISHDLSPTVVALLDAGIYRSKYVGSTIDPNKSQYIRVEPHVNWRLSEHWTLDAGYIYARQKYESQPAAATSNTVYATLSYTWQKYAMSR
jgi:hypothetical protein